MTLTPEELAEIVAAVKAALVEDGPVVDPRVPGNRGYFQVVPGETILASHVNYAVDRGVGNFTSATDRTSKWPSPHVGALSYLIDVNRLDVFDNQITGGANTWHPVGGMRMGYGAAAGGQSIPASTDTLVAITSYGGAANKLGRATWAADGSVTLPLAGTYLVSGHITWTQNTTGERRLYVKRFTGGAWGFIGVAGGSIETNVAGTTALRQGVTAMVMANAGEKIGLFARQNSGAAIVLVGGVDQPHLGVHLLGGE